MASIEFSQIVRKKLVDLQIKLVEIGGEKKEKSRWLK